MASVQDSQSIPSILPLRGTVVTQPNNDADKIEKAERTSDIVDGRYKMARIAGEGSFGIVVKSKESHTKTWKYSIKF